MKEELLILNEATSSKLFQILQGVAPNIYTVGFLTAENPMAQKLPTLQNKALNKELEKYLRNANYGYRKVEGFYEGNKENSFLIINIKKKFLEKTASLFNQMGYVFGLKVDDWDLDNEGQPYNNPYMDFEMWERKSSDAPYSLTGKRTIYTRLDEKDKAVFYSKYKGKKFLIPFFDDSFKDARYVGGKMSFHKDELDQMEDQDERVVAYTEEIISRQALEKSSNNLAESFLWKNRGIINNMMGFLLEIDQNSKKQI